MAKLVALLSGGVDSAVAAALAIDNGHSVVGMTMKQWPTFGEETRLTKGCSVVDAVADSARVCDVLDIPHYAVDFTEVFEADVIRPFVDGYLAGETPNPCVVCNSRVRFGAMLDRAIALGFDGVITGHWARKVQDSGGWHLLRANSEKDQSYVLYRLTQAALSRVLWPLGEVESKDWVREEARRRGLKNYDRPDSTDVCFVGEPADYRVFLNDRAPTTSRPGPIITVDGVRVGTHSGTAKFTVGQRRGLGVALGEPNYVVAIDGDSIVIGTSDALNSTTINATQQSWILAPPEKGERLKACVRYRAKPAECQFWPDENGFQLTFDAPVRAAAKGQSVVLYRDDAVVGGGIISSAQMMFNE